MYPELFLMRHGQTEWNRAGRHQGRHDSRLTEKGRAQARALAPALAEALAGRELPAFVSPLGRARETAALALAPLAIAATPDPRLAEIGMGQWETLTDREIYARFPGAEARREADPWHWYFTAPGGETLAQVEARSAEFLASLTGPAIVIGHGVALRVLRGLWLGLDWRGACGLEGGQGVIWHLSAAGHRVIVPGPEADFIPPDT